MGEKKISSDLSGIRNALTVAEVAELLGLSTRTIRNYIADGRLVGFKVGSQWRFTQESALKLIEESTAESGAAAAARQTAAAADGEVTDFSDGGAAPVAYMKIDLPAESEAACAALIDRLNAVAEALAADDAEAVKVEGQFFEAQKAAQIEFRGALDVAAKLLKAIRKG